jgi:hypothetical protein
MIVAPLLLLCSAIVTPTMSDTSESAILNKIAGSTDMFYLSIVLLIVGLVLLVPAILGLMHLLRERHADMGHVGGGLSLIGTMMFMLYGGVGLMQWQMVRGGANRGEMVALLDRFNSTAGSALFLYLGLAFSIGMIVLAAGLYMGRFVHWSTAGLFLIGAVVLGVALFTNITALFIIATAMLFVAFATIGLRVLTETDEAWEHTPEWRGFRPLPH